MSKLYAIKDNKTNLFYNATQNNLSELTAAIALYKNKKRAEYEVSFISAKGGIANRINRTRFEKQSENKRWQDGYYEELNIYEKQHKNDFDLVVVEIELKEV